MSVSNLMRSILVRSRVVWSMSVLSISRHLLFVSAITFFSTRACTSASSASRVQIIWMPSRPICAGIFSRNGIKLKFGSLTIANAWRMIEWSDCCDEISRDVSHVSTEPSARIALSN